MADDDHSIGKAISCWECGYDLRACDPGGTCPECGQPAIVSFNSMRVDGRYLVVGPSTRLPHRCIKTNVAVDRDPVRTTLFGIRLWAPLLSIFLIFFVLRFANFTVFASGLLALPLFGISTLLYRRRCDLTYWESPTITRRRKQLNGAAWAMFIVSIFAWMNAADWVGKSDQVRALMVLAAVTCDLIWLCGLWVSRPLHLMRYKDGKFWIGGCGEAFLKSIEAEQILMATTSDAVQRTEPRTQ